MKKLLTLTTAVAVATAVFGMAKAPSKDECGSACQKDAVVKEACCTTDGSCKADAACKTACDTAKDACDMAEKAECAEKAADKTECAGGTCPLSK